ncbi:Bifunctional glutamate/proline--tRNA ligase [Labeo rohita]|uniref:Bifunctional glutamate/proline--tRNA ligase n=1 Tax=Labeo rohita TaxID=84645 RepID=A0ABQ8LYZ6_LABRO|nr:Bifunctional glutamate/proline--tRNA ligase [Labeo rohita]
MSHANISELQTRLRFLRRGGVPVPLPRFSVPPGATSDRELTGLTVTVRNSPKTRVSLSTSTSQPVERPKEQGGPSREMSIAAWKGEPDLSGEDDPSTLAPTRRSAVLDTDPEMMAMLAWTAESVGLDWKPPSRLEPPLLDDWYLGVARAGSQGPTPWPLMADQRGGIRLTRVPGAASTWRGNPLLPSRACRHSLALIGSAYAACGEAGSSLHAMVLLQVHQAKALKDLYEGGHNPEVLKELCITTDLVLRAAKVTAQSLGCAMSTMVVQERHLWLCLAGMRETDKIRFLNALVSQTSLFGDAVENYRKARPRPGSGHRELAQDTGGGQQPWRFGRDPNSAVTDVTQSDRLNGQRLGYVCNLRSLKEGTEMSRPVAMAAVPPRNGQVTGSAPQRKPDYALHLLHIYTHARDPNSSVTDVTSPFLPSGNEANHPLDLHPPVFSRVLLQTSTCTLRHQDFRKHCISQTPALTHIIDTAGVTSPAHPELPIVNKSKLQISVLILLDLSDDTVNHWNQLSMLLTQTENLTQW